MDSLPPIATGRGGAVRTNQTTGPVLSMRDAQQSGSNQSSVGSSQRHTAAAASSLSGSQQLAESALSPSLFSKDGSSADRRVEWVVQQLYGSLMSTQAASVSDAGR
jgi:hypothetical protein